jgi:hypothetical protein
MSGRRKHDGIVGQVGKLVGAIAMAGAGILALAQLPSLRRYLRMKRMAAPHTPPQVEVDIAATSQRARWGTSHWPRN